MRVRYTRQAHLDIVAISAYLAERSPGAAKSVISAVEAGIAALVDFPLIAPETDEAAVHELTIPRYPYKVYYEVVGDEVRILHVRDARRRPWRRGR